MPDNETPKIPNTETEESDSSAISFPTEGKEWNFNQYWPEEFEKFWKPLLQTFGQWDEQKIKNEMHDLVFAFRQVSMVYAHITGGKLSKENYYAGTIIPEFDDQMTKSYDDGHKDGHAEGYEEGHEEGLAEGT